MKANEHLATVASASPSSAGELSLDTYHAALQALRRDEIFTVGPSSSSWQAAVQLFGVAKAQLRGPGEKGPVAAVTEDRCGKPMKETQENYLHMVGFLYLC